jgi:UDP-N-acetylmuramyl tripeptide synthase
MSDPEPTPPAPPAPRAPSLGPRARVALAAGAAAAGLSQRLGRGRGGVIGGEVAHRIAPDLLARLSAGRAIALVSATNGKSTTSTLLAAAVETLGRTAFNTTGSNMETGLVTALANDRTAPYAVLEVDEAYLGPLAAATRPRVATLMNLSTDYLERGVRATRLARHWRETLAAAAAPLTVVANADDPLVTWAAQAATDVVWVAGAMWYRDVTELCRTCLVHLDRDGDRWWCARCGWARPEPAWSWDGELVRGPGGLVRSMGLELPGRAARSNALFALASAVAMGADPSAAADAIARVPGADGRYRPFRVGDHVVRLLLSKNPASWTEVVAYLEGAPGPTVFVIDSRGVGGKDCALIWEAPIEGLAGRPVVASGSRARDLALRLEVAGAIPTVVDDAVEAVRSLPPGEVTVAANYPAFLSLAQRFADLER